MFLGPKLGLANRFRLQIVLNFIETMHGPTPFYTNSPLKSLVIISYKVNVKTAPRARQ